ncbi:Disease resistance protein [Melia azedarach]|uniref:Disease resistance protein n=1 Tax=Melia azedarach TaxID=155640 RepID=A0ACC1Y664_MELAZ|nr:Disease resistance protein [Melia azedarach]
MATKVLLSFVESTASKMGSLTFPYIQIMFCLNSEKKKFMLTLSAIKAVLLDAEGQQKKRHIDEVWLEMLQRVLYDAEDLVDELSTEDLRQQEEAQSNMVDKVLSFFSMIPFYVTVAFRMKSIRDRINDIANCMGDFLLPAKKKAMEDSSFYVSQSKIIGREADKKAVIELLMDSSPEDTVSVIPIVGIGGLGKTALAQFVYDDEKVKKHFELRLWACISDNFELKVIVKKILESALNREPGNLLMNTLQDQLRRMINGKRYLLVLDNVWNENYQKWIDLKDLLMGGARGSKIIVTTRSVMVARTTDAAFPYPLGSLSEHESWSLFTRMAFEQVQEPRDQRLVEIGKEIVRKCAGVPLAIRTIGSILRFKNSESEWLDIRNNNFFQIGKEENDILPILKFSYDRLPIHLRHCLRYCSLFPKGFEIDKETLINLWMAQGFLQPSNENRCPEDIGHQYFMDLLLRSFFQGVERDEWGNIIKFRMHDLMHDLAKSVAGTECITNLEVETIDERTHHLSIDCNFSSEQEIPIPSHKVNKIRTFLLPVQKPNLIGVSESGGNAIFSSFSCLRVLDMHNLSMEIVSSSIVELKHLRYLDLSGNRNIKALPDSVTRLQNLQTLKLNNCWKLRELPRDIRKLNRLRHLEINKTKSLNHMPRGLGTLISLRTLTRFAVGKDSSASRLGIVLRRRAADRGEKLLPTAELGELYGLNNLRGELMIKNLCNVVGNAALESNAVNLGEKQYLQSLILQWGKKEYGTHGTIDLELLERLQPHPNLKQLSLYGYGGVSFPRWMYNMGSCLPKLTRITISDCKILYASLPALGQLPRLKSLHLYNFPVLEYIDTKLAESAETSLFFPALKELKLVSLTNLKGWWRNQNQHMLTPYFPCLSKLHIRNCPNLTYIPPAPRIEELDLRTVSAELLKLTMTKPTAAAVVSSSAAASLLPSHSWLKSLRIEEIKNLESLPENQIQELTSLEQLEISSCPTLMRLPEERFRGLTSLRMLTIRGCDRLMYLSRGIQHLTALQLLTMDNCFHLKERIQECSGKDSLLIQQVPLWAFGTTIL